jgi:hypothetical protein
MGTSSVARDETPRQAKWVLLLIVASAAVLRIEGLKFGLPHTQCRPDESRILNLAVHIANGDLNPHYFVYPTLYMYLLAALIKTATLIRGIDLPSTPAGQFLIYGRLLTAAFGTLTVVAVYALGRRVLDGWCGLVAATLMAVAFLHVRDSHFGTLDVPMTFGVVAGLLLIMNSADSLKRLAVAGLIVGLTASIKYNAVLLLLSAVGLEAYRVATGAERLRDAAVRATAFTCALLLGFAAGTPFALVDTQTFADGVRFVGSHLAGGHVHEGQTLAEAHASWRYLSFVLPAAVGWPAFLLAIPGVAVLLWRRRQDGIVLLVFVAAYCFATFRAHVVFARYVIPLVPVICLGAAYLIRMGSLVPRAGRASLGVVVAATLAVAAPMVLKSVRLDVLLARADNRLVVRDWMRERLPAGATLWQSGSIYGKVQFPPATQFVEMPDEPAMLAALPDYILVQSSPLSLYSPVSGAARTLVDSRYTLLKSFPTGLEQLEEHDYDAFDAFFVPLTRLDRIDRPGPAFSVYGIRDARSSAH